MVDKSATTADWPKSPKNRPLKFTQRSLELKIEEVWNSVVGDYGYCDLWVFVERLFMALYSPENINVTKDIRKIGAAVIGPKVRQKTKDTVRKSFDPPLPYPVTSGDPSKSPQLVLHQFLGEIRTELLETTSSRGSLFPGLLEILRSVRNDDWDIIVWSAGDPIHQLHKLFNSGIGVEDGISKLVGKSKEKALKNPPDITLKAVLSENKFSPEAVEAIQQHIAELSAEGERPVIVAEDRAKNILKFLEHVPGAHGVWVLQGDHAQRDWEKLQKYKDERESLPKRERAYFEQLDEAISEGRVVVRDQITDIQGAVREILGDSTTKPILFIDHDDTQENNNTRRQGDLKQTLLTILMRYQKSISSGSLPTTAVPQRIRVAMANVTLDPGPLFRRR